MREEISKKAQSRDFPGGPVVGSSPSNAEGSGSVPSQGPKIPHALRPKHKTENRIIL